MLYVLGTACRFIICLGTSVDMSAESILVIIPTLAEVTSFSENSVISTSQLATLIILI